MPSEEEEENGMCTASSNAALADELEALTSIYEADTLALQQSSPSEEETIGVLRLPDSDVSFLISFPPTYPDVPPSILGTQSTGAGGRRGQGDAAVSVLRDVLAQVYVPGQVCLFDLVEEAGPLLLETTKEDGAVEDLLLVRGADDPFRSVAPGDPSHEHDHVPLSLTSASGHGYGLGAGTDDDAELDGDQYLAASQFAPPDWTLSESLTVNKSTFIARACRVDSLAEAHASLAHLLSSNKKVASATHNISAWRMKVSAPNTSTSTNSNSTAQSTAPAPAPAIIQDSDDDGETAAGGRLLHLLQLMDAWNVLVVVTRWYGGVKLGPDRFRLINSVAREAVLRGGFARDKDADKEAEKEKEKDKKGKGHHHKGGKR